MRPKKCTLARIASGSSLVCASSRVLVMALLISSITFCGSLSCGRYQYILLSHRYQGASVKGSAPSMIKAWRTHVEGRHLERLFAGCQRLPKPNS